jgi:Tfp pilus assembly protein PilF
MGIFSWRRGAAAVALSAACLSGCEHVPAKPAAAAAPGLLTAEPAAKVGPHEAANVKAEYAHMMEKRDDLTGALAAYQEARTQDPSNLDALLGMARVYDAQGRFDESMDCYRKAEAARPHSTKVACNYGYSLYLQGRHAEAEAALRQALARQPDNAPAHTNLGLVLARTGRRAEAIVEFRRAGCSAADAHVNVAFALTLEKSWAEARAEYDKALALEPSSAAAKKGLQDLELVLARAAHPAEKGEPAAE